MMRHTLSRASFRENFERISEHDGGRNIVYSVCGGKKGMLRVSYAEDRTQEEMLAEAEFVKYLHDGGAQVVDVFPSKSGRLVEQITHSGHTLYLVLFEKAAGDAIAEHGYRYLDGVPIEKFFTRLGKRLEGCISSPSATPQSISATPMRRSTLRNSLT